MSVFVCSSIHVLQVFIVFMVVVLLCSQRDNDL